MSLKVENLKETIMKSRPNVKESTIKMYESNLKKLKKMFDTENYDFLEDVDAVKEKIGHLHFTSQRNYFNSIIILLMALNSDNKQDNLLKEYNKLRDEGNKMYEDSNATGQISEKQKNNFVPLSEVVKMIEKMGSELKGFKKKELSSKDMMLLQVYIIYNIFQQLL